MHSFLLQDITTVGAASTITSLVQGEEYWLDLSAYQDAFFWIDVKNFTLGGATSIQLAIETSPIKEEAYFLPMVAGFTLAANASPIIKIAPMSAGTTTNPPLARYVRWRLTAATPTAAWNATFRIWLAANSPGR